MDGKYNTRDIDAVVEELATVPEECVFLVDDEAFINRARMRELARAIRSAGVRKRYFTYCRIDSLLRERDLLASWRDIGLERLFIGIEAVSVSALKDYNKRLTVAQIEAGLAAARDMGIAVFAGFIVGTAFARRDFKQLVRFIEHNRVEYPSFTILTPLPGTASLSNFDAVTERQPNGRPNWELFDLQHPVTATALPRVEFMREYENLQSVFAGRSLPYRPWAGLAGQPAGRV
jgi:methyltransferase